ncbi:peroxiredoxin [Ensifer sesbaniae]|jgi:peroxiredoxin (alkyl hydroperoxide reductase subunit C)|uniref:peroxiredoxin n=1 Tax=Ensifer sesbaniae TaxID=1214071 RepID=UPI00156997F7|nr:peroxiredoxin [Ensifer sesbaniae]MCK3777302.1 peroxiredoxin [Ensifer sesbaniae]NRQ17416.1 putative peroxiredoxin [Ensifer sesbaniae]
MDDTDSGIEVRSLRINDIAPGFSARSTTGELSLASYRGRWVLFFSHPADFTPVCTSEFIALARAKGRFAALECELLGLSVDSLYAHVAWLRDIERSFGVRVDFPVIEDPSMAIARAYGMLDSASPSSATVRATYVIDPEGVIRAIVWYPMNVGRSVDELLRLVEALQASLEEGASTPEGWRTGDPLVEAAATTMEEAETASGSKGAWYYRERVA